MEPDEKITLMIVEDETPVRELLKVCIDWEKLGAEIIWEASNAREALDMIEQACPDIILTDIFMPFMDGIEFSRLVMERQPETKIIIITGHDEFEYAKSSVKIGISDFILKPINEEEIENAVLRLKNSILQERNHKDEYKHLRVQLEDNFTFLKEKALNEIITGNLTEEAITGMLNFYGVAFEKGHIQMAVIESRRNAAGPGEEEAAIFLSMQIMQQAAHYFRNDKNICLFYDNSRRVVILNTNSTLNMDECCEELIAMLINRVKTFISIAIGNNYGSVAEAVRSYREAFTALKFRMIAGWNQVLHYSDMILSEQGALNYDSALIDTLSFNIRAGFKDRAEEILESIWNKESDTARISMESIRVAASDIVSTVLEVINEYNIKIPYIFEGSSQPYEKIFTIDNLPEIKEYLKKILKNAAEAIGSTNRSRTSKLVSEVKEFLGRNFTNPELSLALVARDFYTNPSYLSRIFKEVTGQNFSDYLIGLKINKAIELIRNTDYRSYQIAEQVGINDPKYFSACFKKYTGCSVNEFRGK